MALKRNERYPGRFDNPTPGRPQGGFKNRTAPGAQDGSYLEKDWANDWDGFFARLLTVASVTPNGDVDNGSSSQYYDALIQAVKSTLGTAALRNVGTSVNQIPDMTSFTFSGGNAGWVARFPNGLIIQGGITGAIVAPPWDVGITFPVPFPNSALSIWDYNLTPTGTFGTVLWAFNPPTNLGSNVRGIGLVVQGQTTINPVYAGLTCGWVAMGY